MGWGMLMGVGEGLQKGASTYGRIMDEKRKNDFQLQRDEVAFERTKSLEDLRNTQQEARDKKMRGWTVEDQNKGRSQQLEDMKTKRDWEKEDQDKELDVYEQKKKIDLDYGMQLATETNEINKKYQGEEKDKKIKELEILFMEDGSMSLQEKLAIASMKSGMDLSGFYKTPEGKPMTAEMLEQISTIYLNNPKYQKLAEKDPQAFMIEMKKIGDYLVTRTPAAESGGSGEVDPEAVLKDVLSALNKGTETPDSLRKKAKGQAEIDFAEAAIGTWEKQKATKRPEVIDLRGAPSKSSSAFNNALLEESNLEDTSYRR